MQIDDTLRVDLPVEEAWKVLLDIERIAPCLPGAQLQEIEGDEYRGVVKVKVGPITAQYKGTAKFEVVDDETRTAVIVGTGRDTRGQGNASATIKITASPDGDGTRVDIDTDLSITGKVAQFGLGVMADVSHKLLGQFVANLERDVLSAPMVDLTDAEAAAEVEELVDELTAEVAAIEAEASPNGEVRVVHHVEAEPVDLLEVSGVPVLKRLAPIIGVGVALLVLAWWVRRRRRRSA